MHKAKWHRRGHYVKSFTGTLHYIGVKTHAKKVRRINHSTTQDEEERDTSK